MNHQFKDQLIARWQAFSMKEQSFLTVLLIVILCLVFYAFMWLPVQHGRERLSRVIPEKKTKLLLMRSQAADVERLRGQFNNIRSRSGGLKAAIAVSAQVNGLKLSYATTAVNVANNDERNVKVTLMQVSFDAWLKWVESLQSQHHVRVQSCQIMPSTSRGLVNIDAVFTAME